MCNKKLYVPTLMQGINLMHQGQLSEKKNLIRLADRHGVGKENLIKIRW